MLIWTVLPASAASADTAGRRCRLLARGSRCGRFIGERVFRAVLIDRNPATRDADHRRSWRRRSTRTAPSSFSRGNTQHRRGAAAAVQERALLSRQCPAGHRTGAGMDRKPELRHAQGRVRADPAVCTVTLGLSNRARRPTRTRTTFPGRSRNALLALATRQRERVDDRRSAEPRLVHRGRGGC